MPHTHHSHDHHNHSAHDHSQHNHAGHQHKHDDHAGHDHSHHHAPEKFTWAFVFATSINLLFVILEVIYALKSHSTSLLADAGHNFGDVLGLAMAGMAMWLLRKQAGKKYSYGFKRTTILAALLNSTLLVIATCFIVFEAIDKLLHPVFVHENIMMIVAAIGIIVNGGTALLFMRGQEDLNVKAAFMHLAYDALISLGVVIVGALVLWTHWLWIDPIAGLLIAITILFGTWGLLRQSLDLILDAVPKNINAAAVQTYLASLPKVTEVHHLHIWGLSTREAALTAHLVVPNGDLSDDDLHAIHEQLAHEFNINHATLQVERGEASHEKCEPHC